MSTDFIHTISKNFFRVSFTILVIAGFLVINIPFVIPVTLGGILALALSSFVGHIERRGFSRNMSLLIFCLTLLIVGMVPLVAFILRGAAVLTTFFQHSGFTDIGQKVTSTAHLLIHKGAGLYGVNENLVRAKFDAFINSSSTELASLFAGFATELPEILFSAFITILSLYCFLKEAPRLRVLFNKYAYLGPRRSEDFITMVRACCREVFFSNIITGIIQATIVMIGALVFDIGDAYLVFFITFIVSFIPIIGAAPVAFTLALICFMDSRSGAGIGMLAIALVSGISDNVARPFLGSRGTVEVHPFIGLLSVIGGVIIFGLPGLFMGPLFSSLLFGAVPIVLGETFPQSRRIIEDEHKWDHDLSFERPSSQDEAH